MVATGHTRCEKRPERERTALNTRLREGSLQQTVGGEGGGREGGEGGKGRPEQPEPAEEAGLTGNPYKRKWDEQKTAERWGRKVSRSRKSQNRKGIEDRTRQDPANNPQKPQSRPGKPLSCISSRTISQDNSTSDQLQPTQGLVTSLIAPEARRCGPPRAEAHQATVRAPSNSLETQHHGDRIKRKSR